MRAWDVGTSERVIRLWVWEIIGWFFIVLIIGFDIWTLIIVLRIILRGRIGVGFRFFLKSIGVGWSVGFVGFHFLEELFDIFGFIFEEMHGLNESNIINS